MKQIPQLKKIMIPVVAAVVGLIIGLGVGQFQIKKEQKVFQNKIKEANKKMTFLQKKMTEEKTEATTSIERKYQTDLDKLQEEKKALGGQMGKFKEQARNLEAKIKETDEASAKTKKELQELGQKYTQATQHNKDLERDLKKMAGEKGALQAELKKTTQNLGTCAANNAKLCVIAEDLVKAYRNKGIGTALLEKEPLTQIKKVEMEQLTQKYREEIDQQKIKKK